MKEQDIIINGLNELSERIIKERSLPKFESKVICEFKLFNKELKIKELEYNIIKEILSSNNKLDKIEKETAMGEELEFGYKDNKVIFCYNKFTNILEYNNL